MKKAAIYILTLASLLNISTSCDKWLEATASDKLAARDLFSDREGCLQALTGIYLLMASADCYGADFTWYANDLASYPYQTVNVGADATAYYLKQLNFDNINSQAKITSIWRGGYNVIANINMMLRTLEATPGAITLPQEAALVRAELLGLRAFVHFDLVRMFGRASFSDAVAEKKTIPYITAYTMDVTPQVTYREFRKKLLADLDEAITLLEANDPMVVPGTVSGDLEGYWEQRTTHLNYYAALALKARISMWSRDKAGAAELAEKVIKGMESHPDFAWADLDFYQDRTIEAKNKDYTFPSEHVFSLYVTDIVSEVYMYCYNLTGQYAPVCTLSDDVVNTLFPPAYYGTGDAGLEDVRGPAMMLSYAGAFYTSLKHQCAVTSTSARMPLIKISEMYFIMAEKLACVDDDVPAAMTYINTIRRKRGITEDYKAETFLSFKWVFYDELYREFMYEGQFGHYKRRLHEERLGIGGTSMSGEPNNYAKDFYFPYPDSEINYGRVQE